MVQPYARPTLGDLPMPCRNQRHMKLAIIPMFRVEVCLHHTPHGLPLMSSEDIYIQICKGHKVRMQLVLMSSCFY